MVLSLSAAGLFVLALAGLLLVPKTEARLNGTKVIIMGIMALFCYLFLAAYLFYWGNMPVSLGTMCIPLALLNEVLWGRILTKRKVQRLFFRLTDILSIAAVCVPVTIASLHIFTENLELQYRNLDAAVHFSWAMYSVKYQTLYGSGTNYSAFIDALFIQLLSPVFRQVLWYKAFIVADIFMHILEVCMFYVLVITISDKKIVRIMAPVLSVGYFWGYPAYSFMVGNFVYWSNGVMILIFIIYALVLWEKGEEFSRYSILLLVLGAFANFHCNKLFIPINSAALFVTFMAVTWRKIRNRVSRKRILAVVAGGVAACALFACFYLRRWNPLGHLSGLWAPGAMYCAMYCDIIFFLPALFYVTYYAIKSRKQEKTVWLMSICMLLAAAGMYVLWYERLLSNYYYYKIYYNVWLCGWLLVAAALVTASEKKQLAAFFSCAGMAAVISLISLSDYDRMTEDHNDTYNGEYATAQLFPLFRFNADNFACDYTGYRVSDQLIDVLDYALENCSGESIWIISSDFGTRLWGNGISYFYAPEGLPDDPEEILAYMRESGVGMFVAVKGEPMYRWAGTFESCRTVYENDGAVLLTTQ